MQIKSIDTETDYQEALKEIGALMMVEPNYSDHHYQSFMNETSK